MDGKPAIRVAPADGAGNRITAPVRVHCGYHKCLTMYTRRTYRRALRLDFRWPRGFRHFSHWIDDFYRGCMTCRMCLVSGHAIDLDRFDDIRVVRIIRDPRDLLVSGYHYHLKGVEGWSRIVDPTPDQWSQVRAVPDMLPRGDSLMSYLQKVSRDEGMRAELAFRRLHFESMREWPVDDSRVKLFRYEDIMGNEVAVFREIFEFIGLPRIAQVWGLSYARRHASNRPAARRDQSGTRAPDNGRTFCRLTWSAPSAATTATSSRATVTRRDRSSGHFPNYGRDG